MDRLDAGGLRLHRTGTPTRTVRHHAMLRRYDFTPSRGRVTSNSGRLRVRSDRHRQQAARRLAQLGDRQHEPHQVRLPGEVVFLVNLLQVPIDGIFGVPGGPGHILHSPAFR